jgi:N-acetylneuraminate lyase
MKNYQRLEGMVAATFTPMDAAGNINPEVIKPYAELMASAGVTGVFVCGTTGEAASLTIDERNELPFYYYNMPAMTGVDLSVPCFLHEGKKEIPNLAGTKFTHNNLMEMAQCLNLDNGAFEVLHGYDEILTCGVALGAVAGVGSTYNYIPSVYAGIFEAMKKNDLATARALQKKSVEVVEVIIKYGGGVRGGKAIMNLIGIECGSCRSPIASFTDEEYDSLKEDLNKIGFFTKK